MQQEGVVQESMHDFLSHCRELIIDKELCDFFTMAVNEMSLVMPEQSNAQIHFLPDLIFAPNLYLAYVNYLLYFTCKQANKSWN